MYTTRVRVSACVLHILLLPHRLHTTPPAVSPVHLHMCSWRSMCSLASHGLEVHLNACEYQNPSILLFRGTQINIAEPLLCEVCTCVANNLYGNKIGVLECVCAHKGGVGINIYTYIKLTAS